MDTERRSLIVGTVAVCLLGGLLTGGVLGSAAQERRGLKAGSAAGAAAGRYQSAGSQGAGVLRGDEALDAERTARALRDLQRLDGLEDGGGVLGRVTGLFEFLEHRDCAGGVCQSAQQVTEDYVRARAALIRQMVEAFLASDGAEDSAQARQELASSCRTAHSITGTRSN